MAAVLLLSACISECAEPGPPGSSSRPLPPRTVATARVLHVRDFGARPDDGANDLSAIQSALDAVVDNGQPTELVFAAGRYTLAPEAGTRSLLVLRNARGVVVEGNGAELIVQNPQSGLFRIDSSRQVVIRNFSVDWRPLPFTQGTITGKDDGKGTVDVELAVGYPLLDEPHFRSAPVRWALLKDPASPVSPKRAAPNCIPVRDWQCVRGRTYRIALGWMTKYADIGAPYVQLARAGGPVVFIYESHSITLEGITVYTGPGANYVGVASSAVSILRCRTAPRPGRWHSTCADGVLITGGRVGPFIEHCLFEGLGDDAVNLNAKGMTCQRQLSALALVVVGRSDHLGRVPHPRFEPGDLVRIFAPDVGELIGERTVVSVTGGADKSRVTLELDGAVPQLQPADAQATPILFNDNLTCPSFVIRSNTFRGIRRYGVLCQSHDGLIEDNTFDTTAANAIIFMNASHSATGFVPRKVTVRGNTFRNCYVQEPTQRLQAHAAVLATIVEKTDHTASSWQGVRDLIIEGNRFVNAHDVDMVRLDCARGIIVTGNVFRRRQGVVNDASPAVRVLNTFGVEITNNTFSGPWANVAEAVRCRDGVSQNVEVRGNSVLAPEPAH